ncbi:MAG: alcohol dehydrogenase catalytic domain-containing protein [Thermoleophilia bacterium]|nr:alcohol dehydrogenase catalytic domain-containing protein [Thermoleophilia bacterium]
MRAAVCRAFGAPFEIEEVVLDPPRGREVRVEVAACAICGSDLAFAAGSWGGELPAVYGHEAAGIVLECGEAVTTIRPGDRVVVSLLRSCGGCFFCTRGLEHLCEAPGDDESGPRLRTVAGEAIARPMGTGAFAEEALVHESQVAPIPRGLSLEAASLLACGVLTGVGVVLDKVRVPAGSSVVVIGAGGVGLNVVQGAAIAGAEPIVAVDPLPTRRGAARRLGATHVLEPPTGLAEAVRALTEGRGADVVVVTVGRTELVEEALRAVRRGGVVAVVGMPRSGERFAVEAVALVHDDVTLVGHKIGSGSGPLADAIERLVRLYEEGRLALDELVGDRYPLERINDALAEARRGDALRTVVCPTPR